mgnify:CR=1 FL=1
MKDLQILLAAMKYHWRRFKNWFKEPEFKHDEQSNYYVEGDKKDMQRVLYYRAYHSWQNKRCDRRQVSVGTDLFEADTNISCVIKK